jgi:hypothetical protein
MPHVYVVQNQLALGRTGVLEPKFDLSPALVWGELCELLPEKMPPFDSRPVIERLRQRLVTFCDADSLLLIGNPVNMGLAVAVAAGFNGGRVALLQWSGTRRQYVRVEASQIFGC